MNKQLKSKNYFKYGIEVLVLLLGIAYIGYIAPRSYLLTVAKSQVVDYAANLEIQTGDFIFQHLRGPLTEMIANVSDSQYSHCGIIIKKYDKFFVLEAIGPVKETPLNEWISRGVDQQIMIVRLKKQYQVFLPKIIKAAYAFTGRPYDIQYQWDDEKIYCSELIYKAVLNAASMRLADFVKLGDLKWQPYETAIRQIAGGGLPLERDMITPESLVVSDKVNMVFSSFPARPMANISYTISDLTGIWWGSYSLVGIELPAVARVNAEGVIQWGWLGSGLTFDAAATKNFNELTGEFSYKFLSANNVTIDIFGRIDKAKDVLFGQWNDSLGFSGTFILSKTKSE